MPEGKRRAVIVGINRYKAHRKIPKLEGAENDAREIYERLKDPNRGKFEVSNEHYLIGEKATCERIRNAISDLLWETDSYDLVLFYFSGHGFVDSYGNGYLAPYDMLKDKPLVFGISMQELKQVFLNSKNKSIALIILDCCYSGIATKGDKAIPNVKTKYEQQFKDLTGEGRIILASSEEDKVSREDNFKHENEQKPHPHGIYTFHLIEGLDGKASDEYGRIYLIELQKHLEEQVGKQKAKIFAADVSGISAIRIATATRKFNEYIQTKLKEAEDWCRTKNEPTLLIHATDNIHKVLNINAENSKALNLKKRIDEQLAKYKKSVNAWLQKNKLTAKKTIPRAFSLLENLVGYLYFDKLMSLDQRRQTLLVNLCEISIKKIEYDYFIDQCKVFDQPPGKQP